MQLQLHPPKRSVNWGRIREVKEKKRWKESFVNHQNETEESYRKWEEDLELHEKKRKENQEHKIRLFQMLGQMVKPRESYCGV